MKKHVQEFRPWTGRRVAGVYALVFNGSIDYIGQSKSIPQRVARHRRENRMPFDAVLFIESRIYHPRRWLEAHLIQKHSPRFNLKSKLPHGEWRQYVIPELLYGGVLLAAKGKAVSPSKIVIDALADYLPQVLTGFQPTQ
jgi:hypothetical protein